MCVSLIINPFVINLFIYITTADDKFLFLVKFKREIPYEVVQKKTSEMNTVYALAMRKELVLKAMDASSAEDSN
jgi:hypothetical protein